MWKSKNDTSGKNFREQRDFTTIVARNSLVARARVNGFDISSIPNEPRRGYVPASVLTFANSVLIV